MTTEYGKTPANALATTYTIPEIVQILRTSKKTVYKLVKTNAFASKKIGEKYHISKTSFDEWLHNNAHK